MSFTSLLFFIVLLLVTTLYYAIPRNWRVAYLLIISYGFYATWSPGYLLLMIAVTAVAYATGLGIAAATGEVRRNLLLGCGAGAILAIVVGFKLAGQISGLLFPLGLSYYSFKLIGYLVEVNWDDREVERAAPIFFLYPAFFPQVVSGPIQRSGDFFAQMRHQVLSTADYGKIEQGMRLILGGLMLKLLVGDRLGSFIETVDRSPGQYRWTIVLTTVCCFTLQLYADFAGYTNIAIGIGKLFGIDAPPNFRAPFAASNIQEMWRRWHMSLTSWITDYIFTPLNMALRNLRTAGLIISITATMVTIGLWHGITVNYLVFGLFHALFLTLTALSSGLRRRMLGENRLVGTAAAGAGIVLTFTLMTFTQVFFHSQTLGQAAAYLKLLSGASAAGQLTWSDMRSEISDPVFVCMAIALYAGLGMPGMRFVGTHVYRFVPNWVVYGFGLLMLSALTTEAGTKFIYGQF